jgi:endogenous inhibitor of DNA gyrase (YacG/DUF329 family)
MNIDLGTWNLELHAIKGFSELEHFHTTGRARGIRCFVGGKMG